LSGKCPLSRDNSREISRLAGIVPGNFPHRKPKTGNVPWEGKYPGKCPGNCPLPGKCPVGAGNVPGNVPGTGNYPLTIFIFLNQYLKH